MLAAGLGLLAGCRSAPQQAPDPSTTPSARPLPALLDRLEQSVVDRDPDAFRAQLSDADPGFAGTAEMIFGNLSALRPRDFSLRATGRTRKPDDRRSAVLGADAYSAEVAVGWAVQGDRTSSDQTVWLTVTPAADGLLFAGTADGPREPHPTPLWWLEPTEVESGGLSTVIGGAQVGLDTWTKRADRAARAVDRQLGDRADWNRRLVLIVPSNVGLLEKMLGVEAGDRDALAAITVPDGSRSAAPDRIVINPTTSVRQTALGIDVLLAHEAVHVATASPDSPAPDWLVEGFADHIAYRAYPEAARSAIDQLLDDVADNGPPDGLPTGDDFRTSGRELERHYQHSWSMCRFLADRFGVKRLYEYYWAIDGGSDLQRAAAASFGVDHDQLVRDWRDRLRAAAHRGRF